MYSVNSHLEESDKLQIYMMYNKTLTYFCGESYNYDKQS